MRAYLQISSKFCFRDKATWMDDVVGKGCHSAQQGCT
ncbi:hypothetical protein NCF_02939 [Burkholderia pseudomallei]